MSPKHHVLKAEPGLIPLSPYGFVKFANDFLKVAQSIPSEPGFSTVPYYLYCHALELALKAFMLAKGASKVAIKKNPRHDLVKALKGADQLGIGAIITISADERKELGLANEYYNSKGFEYFNVLKAGAAYPDLPDLTVLLRLAVRLIDAVRPVCLDL